MGLQAQTNAEIRDAERVYRQRQAHEAVTRRPIQVIDRLLRDLEELNLRGVKRVPSGFGAPLEQLSGLLGSEPDLATKRGDLRVKIGVVKLMDALFAIQARLLAERSNEVYPPDEDDLFAA